MLPITTSAYFPNQGDLDTLYHEYVHGCIAMEWHGNNSEDSTVTQILILNLTLHTYAQTDPIYTHKP